MSLINGSRDRPIQAALQLVGLTTEKLLPTALLLQDVFIVATAHALMLCRKYILCVVYIVSYMRTYTTIVWK